VHFVGHKIGVVGEELVELDLSGVVACKLVVLGELEVDQGMINKGYGP